MLKHTLLLLALACSATLSFAQAVGSTPGCPGAFGPTKIIQGVAHHNQTSVIRNPGGKVFWVNDTIYILKGFVRVEAGTTLEIEQGTIIMAFPSPIDTSCLVINRGARINVLGDVNNPVVMTSCRAAGSRRRGDWAGLAICGKAPSNYNQDGILYSFNASYGGFDPEDNSGVIQYLRVEYAGMFGYRVTEVGGVTLAGVGVRTTLRNVQVSYSADDSFEWLGGTVNGRFLISHRCLDDDFDTDDAYCGMVQFGTALREPSSADLSGSNAFESNNDSRGFGYYFRPTQAIFSNISCYGPLIRKGSSYNRFFKTGAILKDYTEQDIYNSVFIGWPGDETANDNIQFGRETGGVFIFGVGTVTNALNNNIRFRKNTILQYSTYKQSFATTNISSFDVDSWFLTPEFGNVHNTNVTYYTPYTVNDPIPSFRLPANSPLLNGSSFPAGGTSSLNNDLQLGSNMFSANPFARGFTNVAYRGSHDASSEWSEPWAEYNPQIFRYVAGVVPTRKGLLDSFLSGNGAEALNTVQASPNPAVLNTSVKFLLDQAVTDATLSVMDMNAQTVMMEKATGGVNQIELNTAGLEPGTYILKVTANGTVAKTGKLQVVR